MAFTNRSPIIMQGKVFIQERAFNGLALTSRAPHGARVD